MVSLKIPIVKPCPALWDGSLHHKAKYSPFAESHETLSISGHDDFIAFKF